MGQSRVQQELEAPEMGVGCRRKARVGQKVDVGCVWDSHCSHVTLPPALDLHVPGYRGSPSTARTKSLPGARSQRGRGGRARAYAPQTKTHLGKSPLPKTREEGRKGVVTVAVALCKT